MKENSPVHQLGNFVDRPWGVSEIGGTVVCRQLHTALGAHLICGIFRVNKVRGQNI